MELTPEQKAMLNELETTVRRDLEVTIRRDLSTSVDKHRTHLEKQLSFTLRAITAVILAAATAFYFLVGNSAKDAKAEIAVWSCPDLADRFDCLN